MISIIGLLGSIAFASLDHSRRMARAAASTLVVRQYETALESFFFENGYYPWNGGFPTIRCLGEVGQTCNYSGWEFEVTPAFNAVFQPYVAAFPQIDAGPVVIFNSMYEHGTYNCAIMQMGSPAKCYVYDILWVVPISQCIYGNTIAYDGNAAMCELVKRVPGW